MVEHVWHAFVESIKVQIIQWNTWMHILQDKNEFDF